MSYISPIKLNTIPDMEEGWTDKIAKYIAGETDKLVLESCVKVACDVDEEELLKALQYDRGQYEKGYADGKRDAAPRWVRCEEDKPKERDYYFAFTADAEAFVGEYIPSVDQWWNGDDLILTVTHWMPIEPPKEDA